jgi:hypothetical protein
LNGGGYISAAATLVGGNTTIGIPAGLLAIGSYTFDASYSGDSIYHDATGISPALTVTQGTATPGMIITVAGDATQGFTGDGGIATNAELRNPLGVAADALGNFYIADAGNERIRKVNASGTITTVAGNGYQDSSYNGGFSGDNGPAINAELNYPRGVAVDVIGNIYIADANNNRIRMVSPSGIITTVAGNGYAGFSGDNGLAISAELNNPQGVAVDASGNIYIADTANNRIRKVNPSGTITTAAGNGTQGFSGDDGDATIAELAYPRGVGADASGNIYIPDTLNSRIRKVSTNGIITTVAGVATNGYSGDNGLATSAQLNGPMGATVDATGNIYIADMSNRRIRMVSPNGIITTVAGNGLSGYSGDYGPATSATLFSPWGVAVDASGNLYIADENTRVRMVTPSAPAPSIIGLLPTSAIAGGAAFTLTITGTNFSSGATAQWGSTALATNYADVSHLTATVPAGLIATVGTANVTVTTPAGTSAAATFTIAPKQSQSITFPNPGVQSYGVPPITLGATASSMLPVSYAVTSGLATVSGSALTITGAGSVTVQATQAGDPNYAAATPVSVTFIVNRGTPTIQWEPPSSMAYGIALSSTQLNATASVPGTFAYAPAAGTVLPVGTQTLSVTFTPTDVTDYTSANKTVSLTVSAGGKVTPTITWLAPAAITFGIALSGTQLDATASVPGTFAYSPALGTVLGAGTQTLSVTFTPTDTTDYTTATSSVSLTVNKGTTTATVSVASSATYGTSVTLTAAVIPATSTGSVTFKNGSITLGAGTLSSGTATLNMVVTTANGFAVGSDSITAVYGGDSNDSGSTSSAATLTVTEGTATAVTATTSSIALGSSSATQSLTATVTTTSGTPTGTVTFKVGSITVGSAALSNGGATLNVSPTTANGFTVGSDTITATYNPTTGTGFVASSGTQSLTVTAPAYTITPSTTTVPLSKGGSQSLTLTLASATFADSTSWTATTSSPLITVSPSSGTATLSANGSSTASLTITASSSAANHAPRLPWTRGLIAFGAVLAGVPLARRRKRMMAVLLTALAISTLGFLMSCGGGGGSTSTPPPASPRSYTVTISGTGGVSSTIAVTVQ